jgi:hypothetical protein
LRNTVLIASARNTFSGWKTHSMSVSLTPMERQHERELNLPVVTDYSESDEEDTREKRKRKLQKKTRKILRKMRKKMRKQRKRKMLSDASDSLAMDDSKMRSQEFCVTPESEEDSWDDSYYCRDCQQHWGRTSLSGFHEMMWIPWVKLSTGRYKSQHQRADGTIIFCPGIV